MPPRPGLPLGQIALLMLTQTLGWGSSISLIGVIATHVRGDLGLSNAAVYGGTTVMFLTGAVAAPLAGRLADRIGGLRVLCLGTPVLAAALVALSLATGPHGYLAAWVLFGIGMHLGLATAAYNGITQVAGAGAYRAIGLLTLATGLSSTVFWPLSEWLLTAMDWRALCRLYAAATLGLGLPVHLWLARRHGSAAAAGQPARAPSPAHVAPEAAGRAFALLAAVQVLTASLGTAIAIVAIDLFVALGTPRDAAVWAGALMGLAYLASRGCDVALGARLSRMKLARIVHVALPLSLAPLMVCAVLGLPVPGWLAALSAVLYGLPAGLLGILRPALPFHIFGSFNYGLRLGRLARPTDLANALAPAAFAALMTRSAEAVLWAGVAMAGLACLALLALSRMVSEGAGHRHYDSVA
ncbi:MFS transporter [Roseivivax sp. CAU 1761]